MKKEQFVDDGENDLFRYGVAAVTGWRESMEDEVVIIPDWRPGETGFVAVYDGHNGARVSRFCAKYMHIELRKAIDRSGLDDLHGCLKRTFLRMDRLMRTKTGQSELARLAKLGRLSDDREESGVDWDSAELDEMAEFEDLAVGGSTALVGLVFKNRVVVANAGDCRCVLSREGGEAAELSRDHKPESESEKARIIAAGGDVWRGRISGYFNVSRGLGDFVFKAKDELPAEQQMMSAEPEIEEVEFGDGDEFLVFGSDGIWSQRETSSEDVVNFVRGEERMYPGIKLSEICMDFVEAFIAQEAVLASGKGNGFGTDNMSIVLVDIRS